MPFFSVRVSFILVLKSYTTYKKERKNISTRLFGIRLKQKKVTRYGNCQIEVKFYISCRQGTTLEYLTYLWVLNKLTICGC